MVEAKKTSYPPGINISDFKAEVPLQNLLDKTASSLLLSQKMVVELIRSQSAHTMPLSFELLSKYGFDGNGNHSLYAMKYDNTNSDVSETNMFAIFLCPLKLLEKRSKMTVWQNPAPCLSVYCRPLTLQFIKETPHLIPSEHEFIKNEIHNLIPSEGEGNTVYHKLILTMADGKVCQALTTTASSTCYLCQPVTKPFGMNNLTVIKEKVTSTEHLKFGISPLH